MRVLAVIMLLCAMQAYAGDYSDNDEDYDDATGLYFRVISKPVSKSYCFSCGKEGNGSDGNVFIYDPAKKVGRNLFQKSPGSIKNIIVESEYDAKEKKMRFIGGWHIKNNRNIRARKPNSQFLVESNACSDDKHCLYTIWKAGKAGGEPTVLFAYADATANEWHLDVKNAVVRLLTKKGNTYAVEEFAW